MNRVHLLLTMPWVASAKYARRLAVLFVLPGLGNTASKVRKEIST
jgi:hypothetical protein